LTEHFSGFEYKRLYLKLNHKVQQGTIRSSFFYHVLGLPNVIATGTKGAEDAAVGKKYYLRKLLCVLGLLLLLYERRKILISREGKKQYLWIAHLQLSIY
jgi:hypothetical protein